MDWRIIIESQCPSESMTNLPTMNGASGLPSTDLTLRGIGGVPVLVCASIRPNLGRAVLGEWRDPEQRWRPGSSTGLIRAIPIILGHGFGAFHAPIGNSLFCFACAPCGLRFPSAMDPPQMQSFGTREHGPLAWLRPV